MRHLRRRSLFARAPDAGEPPGPRSHRSDGRSAPAWKVGVGPRRSGEPPQEAGNASLLQLRGQLDAARAMPVASSTPMLDAARKALDEEEQGPRSERVELSASRLSGGVAAHDETATRPGGPSPTHLTPQRAELAPSRLPNRSTAISTPRDARGSAPFSDSLSRSGAMAQAAPAQVDSARASSLDGGSPVHALSGGDDLDRAARPPDSAPAFAARPVTTPSDAQSTQASESGPESEATEDPLLAWARQAGGDGLDRLPGLSDEVSQGLAEATSHLEDARDKAGTSRQQAAQGALGSLHGLLTGLVIAGVALAIVGQGWMAALAGIALGMLSVVSLAITMVGLGLSQSANQTRRPRQRLGALGASTALGHELARMRDAESAEEARQAADAASTEAEASSSEARRARLEAAGASQMATAFRGQAASGVGQANGLSSLIASLPGVGDLVRVIVDLVKGQNEAIEDTRDAAEDLEDTSLEAQTALEDLHDRLQQDRP
jgi:hypothetical protein